MEKSFSIVSDGDDSDFQDDNDEMHYENVEYKSKEPENPKKSYLVQQLKSKITSPKLSRNLSSDSENDENADEKNKQLNNFEEYNPKDYEHLDVSDEIKEVFQYITKYTPQQLNLEYKFKPFIPDYLPAVGDIDAFLKVVPPEFTPNGNRYEPKHHLGVEILDEPAAKQSDPALLHLQLKAGSMNIYKESADMVVKKIDDIEKNANVINKWIKDISDLYKSISSPTVRFTEQMPDLDDLMQEWSEEMEQNLKKNGFPPPQPDVPLVDYAKTVCKMFEIPCEKNLYHALNLLFCLYGTVKNSQLFQNSEKNKKKDDRVKNDSADQLVLE